MPESTSWMSNNHLEPGTPVEVRSTFDQGWKRGFVVDGEGRAGYRLRRQSDDSVLPAEFPPEAVRHEQAPGLGWR